MELDVTGARVDGRKLTAAQQRALMSAKSGISVGYSVEDVTTKSGPEGTIIPPSPVAICLLA